MNEFRKNVRPNYNDGDAAKAVNGNSKGKPDLKTSPFLVLFDYGKNAEGYWNYNRMVLQLEDTVDVMDALFSLKADGSESQRHMTIVPKTVEPNSLVRMFDYCDLFDNSCGHDKKRPDGLDITGLRKGPTDAARKMRDSKIEKEEGYLGPFNPPNKLKVGDVQHMVFSESDEGPAFWSKADRENKHDVFEGYEMVPKKTADLREELESKGVNSQGTVEVIKQRCREAEIQLEKRQPKVVKKGYVGKAKGVFQILYERGWIDPANIDKYSMNGPLNKETQLREDQYSLNYLIRKCEDFVHEKTLLQHHGEALGCIIDRSPKCTPEIAGDGIEFDWAMCKLWYRALPIEEKQDKKKFIKNVKRALSTEVIDIDRTRKFSQRARKNMVGYYKLFKDNTSATPSELKKFKVEQKRHTCVADEVHGSITNELRKLQCGK